MLTKGILLISFISSLLIFLHFLPNLVLQTLGYYFLAVLGARIVGVLTSNVLGEVRLGFLTCSAILYLIGALKPKDLSEGSVPIAA